MRKWVEVSCAGFTRPGGGGVLVDILGTELLMILKMNLSFSVALLLEVRMQREEIIHLLLHWESELQPEK